MMMRSIAAIGTRLFQGALAAVVASGLLLGVSFVVPPVATEAAATTTTGTLTLAINGHQFTVAVTLPSTATKYVTTSNPVTVFVYYPSNATSETLVSTSSSFPMKVAWVKSATATTGSPATIPVSVLAPSPTDGTAPYSVTFTGTSSVGKSSGKTTSGTVGSISVKIVWP